MNKRIAMCLLLLVSTQVLAGQFRDFKPIGKPARLPAGATAVANPVPVQRATVEKAVGDLLANWNQTDTSTLLDDDFYDKTRVSDVVNEKVPRDARIRLMGIQGSQTLEQSQRQEQGRTIISSVVSVTANTQMEFNDASRGFRRLDGQNEYILRIEQEVIEVGP